MNTPAKPQQDNKKPMGTTSVQPVTPVTPVVTNSPAKPVQSVSTTTAQTAPATVTTTTTNNTAQKSSTATTKTAAKKKTTTVKKAATKKVTTKKTTQPQKATTVKKTTTKKNVTKKAPVKKTAAKKTVAKNTTAQKATTTTATTTATTSKKTTTSPSFGFNTMFCPMEPSFNKDGIEKVMKSGAMLSKTFENIGRLMMDNAKKQLDDSLHASQSMMSCKTFEDLAKIQKSYFDNTMKRAVEQSQKITEISNAISAQTNCPMTEQYTALLQSLTKSITKK